MLFADGINPNGDVEFYMDKEDKENELKQILGETFQHSQLSEYRAPDPNDPEDTGEGELVILGRSGSN